MSLQFLGKDVVDVKCFAGLSTVGCLVNTAPLKQTLARKSPTYV